MAVVGVGVDVVDVARFAAALARTPGLAERVFSDAERAVGSPERLAARFAAKEAAAKALGLSAPRFREVEVVREGDGPPWLQVTGDTAELAAEAGVTRWHVSLAHDGGVATAVVLAESA